MSAVWRESSPPCFTWTSVSWLHLADLWCTYEGHPHFGQNFPYLLTSIQCSINTHSTVGEPQESFSWTLSTSLSWGCSWRSEGPKGVTSVGGSTWTVVDFRLHSEVFGNFIVIGWMSQGDVVEDLFLILQ